MNTSDETMNGKGENVNAKPAKKGRRGKMKDAATDVQTGPAVPSHQTMTLHLDVPLTEEERDARFRTLMDKRAARKALEAERKASMKDFKDKFANVDAEIEVLFDVVQRKVEKRPITCNRRPDYKRGVFEWIREDNGKVAQTTPMTTLDKQLGLPVQPAAIESKAPATITSSANGAAEAPVTMVEVIDAAGKSYVAPSEIADRVRRALRDGTACFWRPPQAKKDLELVMVRGEPVHGIAESGEEVALTAQQVKAYRDAESKGTTLHVEHAGESLEIVSLRCEGPKDDAKGAEPTMPAGAKRSARRGSTKKKGARG